MILYIDTADKLTNIKLYDSQIELTGETTFDGSFILSEELVQRIDISLDNKGFSKKDLTLVAVNVGPGSYTGVRIGVTTANSIAFALDIPVVEIREQDDVEKVLKKSLTNKKFTSPVQPIYKNPPHITKKKVD